VKLYLTFRVDVSPHLPIDHTPESITYHLGDFEIEVKSKATGNDMKNAVEGCLFALRSYQRPRQQDERFEGIGRSLIRRMKRWMRRIDSD